MAAALLQRRAITAGKAGSSTQNNGSNALPPPRALISSIMLIRELVIPAA